MQLLLRQIWTLAWKDLLLVLNRKRRFFTYWRALGGPIIFTIYLSIIIRVFWPKENYGIGSPTALRSLAEGFGAAGGGRNTLALVNYGPTGGDIEKVIDAVAKEASIPGKTVKVLTTRDELLELCRSTLYGTTKCYGAAEFWTSPTEGGLWNYTLRSDGALGTDTDVQKNTNDEEIYPLPLQRAIDAAIATINGTNTTNSLSDTVSEYPYTRKTQQQWIDSIKINLHKANVNYIAVVWYLGLIGICYQLVGVVAREREYGMAELLESMMPNKRRWEPQLARLMGHFVAFTLVYFPSWIVIPIIAKFGLFTYSSGGMIFVFYLLSGLALNAFSLFGASFFKKAQLSGISCIVIALVLAVVAQITSKHINSATVAVLSFLFPPMAYVFFFIFINKFEQEQLAANLVKSAPGYNWGLPGIVIWIALIFHIFFYPVMAMLVERYLYGTNSSGRIVSHGQDSETPIKITNFTKRYYPNWFWRVIAPLLGLKRRDVVAVDDLSVSARKGQIMVLVGANGCGKTTTLNAIAGLTDITSGTIELDGTGGIGICPQKNVLWDYLTVWEHAKIFNRLKTIDLESSTDEDAKLKAIIDTCGLTPKLKAYSKRLSGGQKRKLQLIMMLTGDSKVCCIDEVSGGLDPLSRRKIWDILLAERGSKTIVLTTHFLDEAEFLADHMVIMSKGVLKIQGSVSEIKSKLGDGFRFHMLHGTGYGAAPELSNIFGSYPKETMYDQTVYTLPDISHAAAAIKALEQDQVTNYQVTGPTIEEVFMKLAKETEDEDLKGPNDDNSKSSSIEQYASKTTEKPSTYVHGSEYEPLMSGRPIGFFKQAAILFHKRIVILRRNTNPYIAAFLIPIVATAMISILLKHYKLPGCSVQDQVHSIDFSTLQSDVKPLIVAGPKDTIISRAVTGSLASAISVQSIEGSNVTGADWISQYVHFVDTLDDFNNYIKNNYANISPGGFFLGQNGAPTTYAYRSEIETGLFPSVFIQNLADMFESNIAIATQFTAFNYPWPSQTGDALQFVLYFCLVMASFPAFFALYPTIERLHKVRALEYSNSVRSLPLWLAYLTFDWLITLVVSVICIIIFTGMVPHAWWNLGYLFVVLVFYGMASVLLAYVLSLFCKSQLSAFAFCAGGQAVMLLLYLTAVMNIQGRTSPDKISWTLQIVNYTFNLITPIGNLMRALLISLNLFSSLCSGSPPQMASHPGAFPLYGQPITYLIGQCLFMFLLLLTWDHGWAASTARLLSVFKRSSGPSRDVEQIDTKEKEVAEEIARAEGAQDDGLRVLHVSKGFKTRNYGTINAVNDLTFGVHKSEVFALVGPNGAGKSTTITMLRGDIQPSSSSSSIFVSGINIARERKTARSHLGVCPQFDAMDQMTVLEHLQFYAGVRGVEDVKGSAERVVKAVGLERFRDRLGSRLSGGNKRKLSLGIALIGNPDVVLLDEPSSGMDPVAKRIMWQTLEKFVPGRSILLTTHSMEEADHLANRVGVLANHMLDIGTTQHLRQKHGYGFHIHIVHQASPHSTENDMENIQEFILSRFPAAELEGKPYHGQIRFNIPARKGIGSSPNLSSKEASNTAYEAEASGSRDDITVGKLFVLLEENKDRLGLQYYSVSPSTFDEVFLRVVQRHEIEEEDAPQRKKRTNIQLPNVKIPNLTLPRALTKRLFSSKQ